MKTRTLKCIGITALLGLALGVGTARAVDFIDGTITVTPVAGVSLSLTPNSYAFGSLDVNTSSNSATALVLANTGNVNVTVDKAIQSSPGWTAGEAKGPDQYVLYCATAEARIGLVAFADAKPPKFGAISASSNLTNADGASDPVILVSGSVNLWFKLDMPSSVSAQTSRTITVRFTAVPQ